MRLKKCLIFYCMIKKKENVIEQMPIVILQL